VSFTKADHVFAGVHETGINTFLTAFFKARPHYLNYGTSSFVPATTAAATNVAAIAFPGIPGGIQYALRLTIPTVDLFPPDPGGAPLVPGKGQFTVHARAQLVLGCADWVGGNSDKPPALKPIAVTLDVWGLGKPTVMTFGPGNGVVGLEVDAVKIVGIAEKALEAALECLLRMILKAVLANVHLPFHALTAGAFSLTLLHGPEIDNDQVMLFGTV
jgi:hypothetical protein